MSAILLFKKKMGIKKYAKTVAQLLIMLSPLYGLVVFLEVLHICNPKVARCKTHADSTCGNEIINTLKIDVVSLLFDLTTAALLIPYFRKIQTCRARKNLIETLYSISALQVVHLSWNKHMD